MGAAAADAAMAKVACVACLTPNRLPVERAGDAPKCGQCGAPLLDGKPASLDEASFDGVVGRTDLPVVVDFWAPWCGPCRAIPTLVLFRDGQEAKRASGAMNARSLARWVESR